MSRYNSRFECIAKLVKYRRHCLNLTQDDLANLSGYPCKKYISRIENGKSSVSNKRLKQMAEALNFPVAALKSAKIDDFAAQIDMEM